MGIGVDRLFGAASCSISRPKKRGGHWLVVFNVDGGRGFGKRRFKRKPTRKQLAKLRREVCG